MICVGFFIYFLLVTHAKFKQIRTTCLLPPDDAKPCHRLYETNFRLFSNVLWCPEEHHLISHQTGLANCAVWQSQSSEVFTLPLWFLPESGRIWWNKIWQTALPNCHSGDNKFRRNWAIPELRPEWSPKLTGTESGGMESNLLSM